MWIQAILASTAVITIFYLYFNRDPERQIPEDGIVSPADGKIIEISTVKNEVDIKKGIGFIQFATGMPTATMMRIFLSPLDVHVQRSPIEGTVTEIKYERGRKLPAFSKRAWQNENAQVTINSKIGPVKVVLIAGILARRIRLFIEEGQKIEKGQRIGKILLGSQVCLICQNAKQKQKKGREYQQERAL